MKPCTKCRGADGKPTGWMQEAAGDHLGNGRICSACYGRYLEPETEREHQLLIAVLHAESRRITRQRRQHHTPPEVTP